MLIIIKYILRNINEKKFRTFLIVLSIALASGLFFASKSLSITMAKMYGELIKTHIGTSDIVIYKNNKSPPGLISDYKLRQFKDRLVYAVGILYGNGVYEKTRNNSIKLGIRAFDYDDMMVFNPPVFSETDNLLPFSGRKIIVSKVFAKNNNLKCKDSINIEINNNKYRFKIVAIAEAKGLFKEDGESAQVIIPHDKLGELYGVRNKSSNIFIKINAGENLQQIIKDISGIYNRYTVQESLSKDELIAYLNQVTIPFLLMTIMIFFISSFIIYSSFKVITFERLPVIGTFRSIGATKARTDMILTVESVIYGIIGGIVGIFLGFIILWIMTYIMSYDSWTGTRLEVAIDFSSGDLIASLIIAVILTIVSSLVPIIKVSKLPIKDIVLNTVDQSKKTASSKPIIGFIFICISLIIPQIDFKQISLLINVVCIVLMSFGVVMLTPMIVSLTIPSLSLLMRSIFGNIGEIAVKNLKDNKSVLNNIILLSIGLSGIIMINTVSYSVGKEVLNFYQNAKFDIYMWIDQSNRTTETILRSVPGVKDSTGVYAVRNLEIVNLKNRIEEIEGINEKVRSYWNLSITKSSMKELYEGRNIIISNILKKKLKVNKYDELVLKTPSGEKSYRIIDFISTVRSNGQYGVISDKYFKIDMRNKFYENVLIRTNINPDEVLKSINKKFARRNIWGMTIENMKENNRKSNDQMFSILKGFSLLTMLIGIFGIMNNFIISFMERKRHLAIMRSVGMSKDQIIRMVTIESIAGGFTGGTVGMIAGFFFILIIISVMNAINLSIPMHYSPMQFVASLISGIIISLIASISPLIKSSKLQIIEAIKYE